MFVTTFNRPVVAHGRETTVTKTGETERAVKITVTEKRLTGRFAGEVESTDIWVPKSQLLANGKAAIVGEGRMLADKLRPAEAVTRNFEFKEEFTQARLKSYAEDFATGAKKLDLAYPDSPSNDLFQAGNIAPSPKSGSGGGGATGAGRR